MTFLSSLIHHHINFPSRRSTVLCPAFVSRMPSTATARLLHTIPDRHHDQEPEPKRKRPRLIPQRDIPTAEDMSLSVTLTAEEETLRSLLVDVVTDIETKDPPKYGDDPLTLRFTGGWVRDKLLGEQSHDIDVGVNKMTGFEFASRMKSFLKEKMDVYGIPARSVHKIESNPEKSKHLETATTKILGLDIDLVNLRSETYSGDSRIPQMEFGTPVQDALRRDACVNALFYNIHTQEIEDFTGRGLQDMEDKLIRTPLAPFETFDDDPLRVLRLIRFSSRLGFNIVEEAKEAMKNPAIKKALRMKISRERVGVEIEKMLQGPHPQSALSQIYDLTLFDSIFTPPIDDLPELPISHMSIATTALSALVSSPPDVPHAVLKTLIEDKHDRYVSWLLAAFSPWKGHLFPGVDTKKNIPAAATAVREGLKADNKIYAIITSSYRNYARIQEFVQTASAADLSRRKIGMFIRSLGADWRNQYICALLLDICTTGSANDVDPVFAKYGVVLVKIRDMNLLDAPSLKPILNGKEVLPLLKQKKSGPWMVGALNKIMEWQLENPEVGKEEAKEWVENHRNSLLG